LLQPHHLPAIDLLLPWHIRGNGITLWHCGVSFMLQVGFTPMPRRFLSSHTPEIRRSPGDAKT
jgi:hypothetical protein